MQDGSNKIIFYSPAYTPVVGGTEQQTRNLAEFWSAQGRNVWVLTKKTASAPAHEKINNVNVVRISVPPVPVLGPCMFGLRVARFLVPQRKSVRCIVSQMFNTETLMLSFLTRWLGLSLLVRPSSGGPDGNFDKMKRTTFGRWKAAALMRNTTFVIAINDQISKEFKAEALVDVVKIPNGVDTCRFAPSLSKEIAPTALFVGRLDKVKNLQTLLTAWTGVVEKIPQALLWIAGDGPERGPLEASVARLNLSDHVRFIGEVKSADHLYKKSHVFVLPSHREGMSNALLEAMASGLAAAASDIEGNRLLINHERNGLLLHPQSPRAWTDGLVNLLTNAALRTSLGEQARADVEAAFSLKKTAASYEKLFDAISSATFEAPFPILAYHRTPQKPLYGIDIAPDKFEKQIRWLSENGYSTLTLSALYESHKKNQPFPTKKVVITFDDGHKDTFTNAFPILAKYNFTATVFLNTGFLGKTYWVEGRHPAKVVWHDKKPAAFDEKSPTWRTYDFMRWDEAASLKTAGWEIGSHGVTHPFLTELSEEECRRELVESRNDLKEKLSLDAQFFCYPSGDHNPAVRQAVEKANYWGAVVSKSHHQLYYHWNDIYAMDRIGMWNDVAFWKFKLLVKGSYANLYRKIPALFWIGLRSIYRIFR